MTAPTVEVKVLSATSSREELIDALCKVSAEAGRELRYDHLGRPNERWARMHAFLNELLWMLEDA